MELRGLCQELIELKAVVAKCRVSSFSSLSQSINLIPSASSSAQAAGFTSPSGKFDLLSASPGIRTSKRTKTETNGGTTGADLPWYRACAHVHAQRQFLGPRRACAHKELFQRRMNTRCHLMGSGVCNAVANREKEESYVTVRVVTFWSFFEQGKFFLFFFSLCSSYNTSC